MPLARAALLTMMPPHYIAPRLPRGSKLLLDADLEKVEWQRAPWSSAFQDIRGAADAPATAQPGVACTTRCKMLWDDDFLYIGAEVRSDFTVVAEFTERNSPIFHKDSDFEVFIDPAGSCHQYKELELNAINTVWNLMLDRPYSDGGSEFSGRVARPGEPQYYEVKKQRTATRVVSGGLNNTKGATWWVEIALAHSDTTAHQPESPWPATGVLWRINFSRVEKRGEVNWVWAPQCVWDPRQRRFCGKVNIHLPDAWGYVQFAENASDPRQRDLHWPARLVASTVYYAQQAYLEDHGVFAGSPRELEPYLPDETIESFDIVLELPAERKFVAHVVSTKAASVRVNEVRHMQVVRASS